MTRLTSQFLALLKDQTFLPSELSVAHSVGKRREKIDQDYDRWVNKDLELSDGEKNPFLRILIVSDLWFDKEIWADLSLESVRSILNAENSKLSGIPFENVYFTSSGFVGRQLSGNHPHNLGLTWKFHQDLTSEVIIPLNLLTPSSEYATLEALEGYQEAKRYTKLLNKLGYDNPRVVDLNFLYNILTGVVEIQEKFMAAANHTGPYYFKVQMLNAWRTTAFIDSPDIISEFEKHGIPMCFNENTISPRGTDPDSFAEMDITEHADDERVNIMLQALKIFAHAAFNFGIPAWLDIPDDDKSTPYLLQLQQAGMKALKVQKIRNEQKQ